MKNIKTKVSKNMVAIGAIAFTLVIMILAMFILLGLLGLMILSLKLLGGGALAHFALLMISFASLFVAIAVALAVFKTLNSTNTFLKNQKPIQRNR